MKVLLILITIIFNSKLYAQDMSEETEASMITSSSVSSVVLSTALSAVYTYKCRKDAEEARRSASWASLGQFKCVFTTTSVIATTSAPGEFYKIFKGEEISSEEVDTLYITKTFLEENYESYYEGVSVGHGDFINDLSALIGANTKMKKVLAQKLRHGRKELLGSQDGVIGPREAREFLKIIIQSKIISEKSQI